MGLFDFVKEAGEKLLGRDKKQEEAKRSEVDAKAAQAQVEMRERRLAGEILRFVDGLGLGATDLSVRVDGDTATVKGKVPDQATRERVVLAVGNTQGIARVDDRLTVAREEAAGAFYTVVSGDTLSGIAKKHYGNAGKYMVIFEANKPMLKDPDKIYPGQVLRVPPKG